MTTGMDDLHERDAELAGIAAAIDGADRGSGAVVMVEGPAGIGKTRLLGAARELAARRGHAVLRASGGELERDFAFGVARQLFERELTALDERSRCRLLAGAAGLAAPAVGLAEEPAHDSAPHDRLFPVLHGLFWLSANLAARRPLLIEIDDAHWADEQSLLWLGYLARRLDDVPAVITVALRAGEPPVAPGALEAIRAETVTRMLRPRPLSEEGVGAMLRAALGVEPAAAFVGACHQRSGGNPFVVRELMAAVADGDLRADREESAAEVSTLLPGSVATGVLARLGRLSLQAIEVARAVGVLGSEVPLVQAARLAGLDEAVATRAVAELSGAGLMSESVPLGFAHPLIREAVYRGLQSADRVHRHWRAAQILTAAAATPESVAAHLLKAEPHGEPAAVAMLRAAAARASARGAPVPAARYLARALAEPPEPGLRGEVLVELGAAEARVGREEAIEHLEEALAIGGSPTLVATAASELALGFAALGRTAESIAALESAIVAAAGGDRELQLRLEGELGAMSQLDGSMTPRVVRRLHDVAQGLTGATAGERLVLASHAHQRSLDLAPPQELTELADRVLCGGSLVDEQSPDSPIVYLFVYVLDRAQRPEQVDRLLEEALVEARARGSVLGLSVALASRGFIRWLRGDVRDAEADGRTAMDAQLQAGWGAMLPLAVATVAECLLERGRADEAAALFEETGLGGPMPELLMHRWALVSRGRARVAAGRRKEGIEDLLDCERLHMGPLASVAMLWRADAALALAATGDTDRAGLLASEQLALLEEAVSVLEHAPAALEHARALVELGAALRRRARRRDARAPLERGYELARHCGGLALAGRARDELAATGVRLRREALEGIDALTPSERRVAQMAATGRTNPEIAQALFITRKTVEMHLGRTYRKLNVSGREALPRTLTGEAAS
jgi:DNA-binding CsgD family transcriptional regulator